MPRPIPIAATRCPTHSLPRARETQCGPSAPERRGFREIPARPPPAREAKADPSWPENREAILHPPLEGGSKNSSAAKNFSERGQDTEFWHAPSPKLAPHCFANFDPPSRGGRALHLEKPSS